MDVRASYSCTGDISRGNTITTTFTENTTEEVAKKKLNSIAYYLLTATGNEKIEENID